jgi:hypothetical protein
MKRYIRKGALWAAAISAVALVLFLPILAFPNPDDLVSASPFLYFGAVLVGAPLFFVGAALAKGVGLDFWQHPVVCLTLAFICNVAIGAGLGWVIGLMKLGIKRKANTASHGTLASSRP